MRISVGFVAPSGRLGLTRPLRQKILLNRAQDKDAQGAKPISRAPPIVRPSAALCLDFHTEAGSVPRESVPAILRVCPSALRLLKMGIQKTFLSIEKVSGQGRRTVGGSRLFMGSRGTDAP